MAIATATSLDVYVGGKLLFGDVSFKLEPGDRMTLSGRNGAGKSTLLRVLSGELKPEEGSVSIQRGARVALHDQRPPRDSDAKLGDYVFSGRSDMLDTEVELARLEGEMAGGASDETMAAYAKAQARLEAGGGYRWRDEVLEVLRGLGFGPEHADRALKTFSGGELTRASLARALAAKPDLLLLDEPTNHLDIPSLEWLERYLVTIDSAVVLVAHDVNPILPYLDQVIYLAQGGAVMGRPADVITAETLTMLYGTPIEVLQDRAGRLVVVGQPDSRPDHRP